MLKGSLSWNLQKMVWQGFEYLKDTPRSKSTLAAPMNSSAASFWSGSGSSSPQKSSWQWVMAILVVKVTGRVSRIAARNLSVLPALVIWQGGSWMLEAISLISPVIDDFEFFRGWMRVSTSHHRHWREWLANDEWNKRLGLHPRTRDKDEINWQDRITTWSDKIL